MAKSSRESRRASASVSVASRNAAPAAPTVHVRPSASTPTGAAAAVVMGGAPGVLAEPKRPRFIVVFKEKSQKNASAMSRILKVGEAKGQSVRSSCTVLNNNHEWATNPRVYERLGVAAVDLDDNERAQLASDTTVAAVIENEVRRVPPPPLNPGPNDGDQHVMPGPTSTVGSAATALALMAATAGLTGPQHADPTIAYVAGARDMADSILRMLVARRADYIDIFPDVISVTSPAGPVSAAAAGTMGAPPQSLSWCLSMIGVTAAYRFTGRGVRVAVLDTGIDFNHPDFAGRFPGGADTQSFVSGEAVQDLHGHGTHCAGTIAGKAASSGGMRYSVAPDAELMIGKVLSNAGSGFDDQILDGIDWAADGGAQVISMSLGSRRKVGGAYADPYEAVASHLLDMTPGVLIVAATGNESNRPSYTSPVGNPAACPSIYSVGAVDRMHRIASFSNCRMDSIGAVDFVAPGVAVYSARAGGGFVNMSGTSMATPHVAGIAALILEENPSYSAKLAASRLKALCKPIGAEADFGYGLVQAP